MVRIAIAFIAFIVGSAIASAQAPAGRLGAISANKTIKIAYRIDAKPFSFLNAFNEPDGYTIELCKLAVRSLEQQLNVVALKIEWVLVTTETRFDAVANGQADMECGASTVTLGRMKQVDFSSFVFVENTGLVVKRGAGIQGIKELTGKKVGVIAGTSNERAIVAKNEQLKLDATIIQVKDRDDGIAALEGGRVDAFASDKLLLVGAQFANPQSLVMLPDDLSIEPYAIVLPRGDWALRNAINTGLSQTFRSGEVMTIFNKWFSPVGLRPSLLLGAIYVLGALPE